ncbi:NAD(P)-dependent dehydrogenase (short-subunit alcohol dehydrogenase family) [Nocardioides ginsengisegetis]|uniref:NAD(P)-dependent dehydrogenase (Short-subunit alcohol dehydrogenase family) n=1 Tax=Nocardioides ginsengisegetis TaxID=661491 RepID=A0A7W3J264_9ACTN|nr:SDR family oxidoreductase [Nocardioides ginsengisegetis]MBA8804938.1 NAD(P)-dependent dehydrogenase (short-subunit alcohol dehydrogenase family) [Nocardioides ginsengisegetis]
MEFGLFGARAVVTGGSKGIGRAVAETLAAEGASVAVMARGQEAINASVAALHAAGSTDSFGVVTDFADAGSITASFAEVAQRWDELNVLVHTIGPKGGAFENLDDDAWAETLNLGTMGTVRAVRAALPLLRAAEWGRIVTFAASSIRRPNNRTIAYTASKSATASITKTLAKELGAAGILVNCVCPGTIVSASFTESLAPWLAADGLDATDPIDVMTWIRDKFGESASLGRAGLPEEVASLTTYLVSRRNGYVTGATINVDGGSDFF